MAYLGRYQLDGGKGDRHGVICRDQETGTDFLAFVWVDRNRRYFISTASSLATGPPCVRWRWKQVDRETPNAPPEYTEVVVAQPEACYLYYGGCGKIDQHNRYRQASLAMERKLLTTQWNHRVNMSLFAINIVDSFLLAQGCQDHHYSRSSIFFCKLAEELIENTYEIRALRKRTDRAAFNAAVASRPNPDFVLPATHQLASATPTKRHKLNCPKHLAQGRCMVCKTGQATTVCRECQLQQPDPKKKQHWICSKAGQACMGKHILEAHPDRIKGYKMDSPDSKSSY